IQDVFETLVNPERPIPPFVSRLTGIWAETVRDAPFFAQVANDVARRLDGHVFVAHNMKFDWRFVSAELARSGAASLHGAVGAAFTAVLAASDARPRRASLRR